MPRKPTGRPNGRPRKQAPAVLPEPPGPYTEPPKDGMRQLLRDMWHVWYNDPSHDKTQGQRRARAQMVKDDVKFFGLIGRLERELGAVGGHEGPAKRDMGTERARELISRLLDKFEAEEAKRVADNVDGYLKDVSTEHLEAMVTRRKAGVAGG